MFRKNQQHLQASLLSDLDLLTPKQRRRLDESWAGVFRREVFARLDETPFAQLYADSPSRPNIPVNVLVGLEILKAGNNWSDEDLHDAFSFDLQVRYALGYDWLGQGEFDLRTIYNFRQRLSGHMARTGQNLIERAFHQITQEQLAAFELKTSHLRMDSTQIASNICHFSRLQLLVEILQRIYRQLSTPDQARWAERFAPYLRSSSGQYVYHLKGADSQPHLQRMGELMQQCLTELAPHYGATDTYALLDRVFREQFQVAAATTATAPSPSAAALPPGPGPDPMTAPTALPAVPAPAASPAPVPPLPPSAVQAKPGEALTASSLLSPDDREATYRRKGSQAYLGYVTNVTETCHPANPFQLIVQVQTAANTTSDADLLIAALPALKRRTEVAFLYNDAAFCSPAADAVLRDCQVTQIPSSLCGYAPKPGRLNLADFGVVRGTDGVPQQITCPHGQTVAVRPGTKPGWYVSCWEGPRCLACPQQGNCPTQSRSAAPERRLRFSHGDLDRAERRQRCQAYQAGESRLRAAVEATVGALKRRFSEGQLPVRGAWRVGQMMIASALMVNVRRIERYRVEQAARQARLAEAEVRLGSHSAAHSFLSILRRRFSNHVMKMSSLLRPSVFAF